MEEMKSAAKEVNHLYEEYDDVGVLKAFAFFLFVIFDQPTSQKCQSGNQLTPAQQS